MLWSGCVIHQRYEAEHDGGNFFYRTALTRSSSLICLERNCKAYHASGDADVMIIQKAV